MDIFSAQIRAGRALIDWSRRDLSQNSGISEKTIQNFENVEEYTPKPPIVRELIEALQRGGVEFIHGGVRLEDYPEPEEIKD
ncbi:MAG: helix-turn-helix transcriptional regulator [Roseibium sp.]|uniref:helix-turn-helix domain-containing protein n=1 Tax=Roseibium sp. TaxID=1936156 RepID=UPI00329936ED